MEPNKCFAPWINAILVLLQTKEWRGKHRFYLWLAKDFGNKVITHNIDNRPFSVPVGEWCFWLEKGPENYYLKEFLPFCDVLNQLNAPFTLFDLGADIGTVSSLVAVHCENLKNVVAFEPNPKSFEVLTFNLDNLKQPVQCVKSAVSNFDGFATFHADPERLNDHEGYIDNSGEGDTVVTSLDNWQAKQNLTDDFLLQDSLALKIDVEGQEIQLIEGAKTLIESAQKVIILIEVHPEVLARTQHTADDLFASAEKYREFDWIVPLYDNTAIDRQLSLFEQVPIGQYDIIGISR
ncbi:FkbM family methyltransferase [uncultured Paraglaciecola sp.]|uniref:FkbM family methyltransferase n=1 Tax=uncultured Paraglaciecola sp. TaxID=1765024 RepID=UPI0030D743C8|tara:strand:+ start:49262 stop:50140 length:879 start_codon:yes stop_codon:yes gene_type:complete